MDYIRISELDKYFDQTIPSQRSKRLEKVLGYLRYISELVDKGELSTTDPEYISYLDRYCSQSKPTQINNQDLFQLLMPKQATRDPLDGGDLPMGPFRKEVLFGAFYMLIRVSLNSTTDFYTLRNYLKEFEDEFSERPIFHYLCSEVYLQGFRTQHYQTAAKYIDSIIGESCTNPIFYSNFVRAVVQFYNSEPTASLDIRTLPSEREKVLSVAESYSQKAVTLSPEKSEFRLVRSKILELMDEFTSAEEEINKALELLQDEEKSDADKLYSYHEQLNSIRTNRRNAERADQALEEAQNQLEELKDSAEELESDLKNRMENFRNQTIRSIGFFAGLIAVVVTSAQAFLSVPSVAEASRVSLILTGGLIVAFSCLGLVLSSEDDNWAQSLVVAILGLLLIGIGLFTPQIINVL